MTHIPILPEGALRGQEESGPFVQRTHMNKSWGLFKLN